VVIVYMGLVFSISIALIINRNARNKQKNTEMLIPELDITSARSSECDNPYKKLDEKSST
jgi:hypothetical protein